MANRNICAITMPIKRVAEGKGEKRGDPSLGFPSALLPVSHFPMAFQALVVRWTDLPHAWGFLFLGLGFSRFILGWWRQNKVNSALMLVPVVRSAREVASLTVFRRSDRFSCSLVWFQAGIFRSMVVVIGERWSFGTLPLWLHVYYNKLAYDKFCLVLVMEGEDDVASSTESSVCSRH
jgi:hypothetical protein